MAGAFRAGREDAIGRVAAQLEIQLRSDRSTKCCVGTGDNGTLGADPQRFRPQTAIWLE
jgi:hypothetical protein